MPSKEQLRKVAIYCDSYSPRSKDSSSLTSKTSSEEVESCENCLHFTREGRCELDLIDKILSSLAMELDLKR